MISFKFANIYLLHFILGSLKQYRFKTWPLSLGSLCLLGNLELMMGEGEEQGALEKEHLFAPARHLQSN